MADKNITVEMRGDSRGVKTAAQGAVRAVRRISTSAGRAARNVGAIGGALGVVAGGALVAIGAQAAESVDKVAKLGTQLGITTTEVQKLQLQGELSGIAEGALVKAFQQVTRVAGDAQRGMGSAVDAFDTIGIAIDDLKGKNPAQLFQMVSEGLASVEDPALRASAGSVLLGRAYKEMVPLITDAGTSAGRAAGVFDALDLGLDGMAGNVERLNDNFTVLKTIGAALRDQVFAKLAPEIDKGVVALTDMVTKWIEVNGGGDALAETLANDVVGGFKAVIEWVGQAADVVNGFLEVLDLMVKGLRVLGQLGGAVGAAASAVAEGNFSEAGTILNTDLADVYESANPNDGNAGQELGDQTSLLRDILSELRSSSGVAFQ